MLGALRNWVQRWMRKRATPSTDAYTPPPPRTEPIPQEELQWLAGQLDKHGGIETLWARKPDVLEQIRKEYRKRYPPKPSESATNDDENPSS